MRARLRRPFLADQERPLGKLRTNEEETVFAVSFVRDVGRLACRSSAGFSGLPDKVSAARESAKLLYKFVHG